MNRRGSWNNPPKVIQQSRQQQQQQQQQPDYSTIAKQQAAATTAATMTTTTATTMTTTAATSTNKQQPQQPPPSKDDSVIDSALLAALRDPRERIGLLRLEQTLIDFVVKQPQDHYMDVGGPYNSIVKSPTLGFLTPMMSLNANANTNKSQTSFQRCILHRLADRFEITRENNMDGTIRLLKHPPSKLPGRLLLDVKPDEYSLLAQSMEQVSLNANNGNGTGQNNTNKSSFAGAVTGNTKTSSRRNSNNGIPIALQKNGPSDGKAGNGGPTIAKNTKKMKIMKRANSDPAGTGGAMHRTNSSASLKKKNSSLTDREKAYAEARARIFQQDQDAAAAAAATTAATGTTGAAVTANAPIPTQALPSNGSTSNLVYDPSNTFTPSTATTTSSSTAATAAAVTAATAATAAATTSTNSKATFRDRNQDEIDPDFRRGSSVAASVGLEYDHYGNTSSSSNNNNNNNCSSAANPTNDYYGYYNAPQHYPRNQYGQQTQLQQQHPSQPQHAWVPSGTKDRGQQHQHQHQQGYSHYYHYPYNQGQQPQHGQQQQQQQQQFSYIPATTNSNPNVTSKIVANNGSVGG
ncbi:MAG: hypothetical protein SGBAC_011571 [Bacillariaceae sp.]